MKIIEIVIDTSGQTTVQTKGFTAASCRDASRFLEQALGDRAGEQMTPEFYQPTTTQEQIEQK